MNSNIISLIKDKQTAYRLTKERIEQLQEEKKVLQEKTLVDLTNNKKLVEDIIEVCKLILEKLTYNSKGRLEEFLTYALREIFKDRKYEIKLIFKEDTKKSGLELTLVDGGVEQEITEAIGGGVLSVIGLICQIYYLEVYGLNKIMFIDEGLKEVSTINTGSSENYLYNTLSFLKWLSEKRSYKFVIITHDNEVRKFADKIYEVEKGKVSLCS